MPHAAEESAEQDQSGGQHSPMYFINSGTGTRTICYQFPKDTTNLRTRLHALLGSSRPNERVSRKHCQNIAQRRYSAAYVWRGRLDLRLSRAIKNSQNPSHQQILSVGRKLWERELVLLEAIESLIKDLEDDCVFVYRHFSSSSSSSSLGPELANCSLETCRYASSRPIKDGRRCLTVEMRLTYDHLMPYKDAAALFDGEVQIYRREHERDTEYYRALIVKWFCVKCLEEMWHGAGGGQHDD